MKLSKISYDALKPRQKEVFNFQKVAGLLADYGFNCIKLSDDWQGADFLAYHVGGEDTLKVQLKSRLSISKKYIGKDIYIAFPIRGHWYLIEHDELLKRIIAHTNWLDRPSWTDKGDWSSESANKRLIDDLADFCISHSGAEH